ncbi:MAG: cytochrome c biogenesis CcdA family protein [Mycobacterium sp.]
MNAGGYSLAFVAGVVAALNPCGFAMLPGYLGLVSGGWGSARALVRALTAAAAMTLGFITVFGAFALLAISVAELLQRVLPYLTVLIGVTMVWIGGRQLLGRPAGVVWLRLPQWDAPSGTLRSMVGYGVLYALVSLTCTIAPFIAVTGIGLQTPGRAWVAFLAYAAGFGTLVGFVAVAGALTGSILVRRLRQWARFMPRVGAVLLIGTGLYIGYYGGYEVRLRNMAGPDPVISAAQRIQGELAGWAYSAARSSGGVVVAVGLGVAALVVLGMAVRNRLRDRGLRHSSDEAITKD